MHWRPKCVGTIVAMMCFIGGCSGKQVVYTDVPRITPTLTIDFNKTVNKMKPLNGINNGPKSHSNMQGDVIEWETDATEIYKDLDIPYVRTHDTEYPDGSDRFIDIHCIFPDMDRDPNDETAYDFSGTDEYISNIMESGAEVFYRLGESIAPSVEEATHQYPPDDYQKWAEVCEHIISHYNDGWNDGFDYDIRYWEIWNEPDIERQWIGSIEEYYELYKVVSRHLKEVHPDIKVGGGVLASAEEDAVRAFLEAINDDGINTPLDFFSWHLYTDEPFRYTYRANLVRSLLDEYGYEDAETFADEWNYVDDWENIDTTWEKIKSSDIAAFNAACLITLQNSNVDGAMYYDGSLTGQYASWCGLYTTETDLLSGYYAFWAFAQLKKIGNQVEVTAQRDPNKYGVYACAVSGDSDMILLANTSENKIRFRLKSNSKKSNASAFIVNKDNPLGVEQLKQGYADEMMIEMEPWEMKLLTLE